MSFLFGLAGCFLGGLFGYACAMLLVSWLTDGDTWGLAIFSMLFVVPLGAIGVGSGIWGALKILDRIRLAGEPRRRRSWIQIAAALVYLPFGLYSYASNCESRQWLPPSDEEMIANFREHRSDFDRMVSMFLADKGAGRMNDEHGSSGEQFQRYRDLLSRTNVRHGLERHDDGTILASVWAIGSAVSDDKSKGFAYLLKPPKASRASLDNYDPAQRLPETVYRHIDGPWYLYYDYLPG